MYHSKPTRYLFLIFLFCLYNNFAQGQIREIRQELHKLPFIKDSVSLVNSLNRLGTLYRNRNTDSCFYYGMKAKRLATGIHYQKGQTSADHVIAFALFRRGLYPESLELFGKVLSGYKQLADTENIVRTYVDMANVLNKDIDKTKVTALLQKAIQMGGKLKKDSIMATVYVSYCILNTKLSADSTNYYINRSREIASRYKDEAILAFNRMWQADLLIKKGQKREALSLITGLLSDVKHTGDFNMEINLLFTQAYYYDDNNPRKSLEYCYQAYELARKSGDKTLAVYLLTDILEQTVKLGNKDEIITAHVALEKAMIAEKENTKRFIGDYVRYNAIQDDNKLLSEKNAQRTLWLLIVSFSATLVVLTIYLIMLYRNRKAQVQVQALNEAANMQVIAMEEAKHQAVREEQQRMGQDLHDGLSSSIAAIRYQLETLSMDTRDTALKTKLDKLQAETMKAYEAARRKSHEWFSTADEQHELSFEKQIRLLTDNALPDSRYHKTIHIDNNCLVSVSTDTRIALLRIIQEAVTNIIKHAKAKNVNILIYEEGHSLILTISDDGIGLDEKKSGDKKSTMGLKSIHRRVQYLNGEIDIHSNTKGTEIIISVPLA